VDLLEDFIEKRKKVMDKMKSTKTMIKKTAGTYGTELVTN
jgi:hypothetical protein